MRALEFGCPTDLIRLRELLLAIRDTDQGADYHRERSAEAKREDGTLRCLHFGCTLDDGWAIKGKIGKSRRQDFSKFPEFSDYRGKQGTPENRSQAFLIRRSLVVSHLRCSKVSLRSTASPPGVMVESPSVVGLDNHGQSDFDEQQGGRTI
jgi:hypothetical protein